MKKLALASFGLALVLGTAACSQEKTEGTEKQETITFATTPDSMPFNYKENGKLTGFDTELVEALAAKENIKVEWKEMKFNGVLGALESKQVDGAAAAMTIKPEREKMTNFTDPYFESGLVIVTKKDSAIESLEDLEGKTIVAKQGSSGLAKANELAEQYGAKVKILEDEAILYMDVQQGNSDALVNDFPFVASKLKSGSADDLQVLGEKLTGENYGIAIVKGEEDLLKEFNENLKEMKDNGEYQKLYDKYFGTEK